MKWGGIGFFFLPYGGKEGLEFESLLKLVTHRVTIQSIARDPKAHTTAVSFKLVTHLGFTGQSTQIRIPPTLGSQRLRGA